MQVEIWSDVVCPWCYIGKRRFERALATLADDDTSPPIDVVYRPFQLDPTAPPGSTMPVVDAYARKFGGYERAQAMIDRVTSIAADEGLEFHLERAQRANTLLAHRLLWWASDGGTSIDQRALKERLLRAYFVDGENVGDPEALVGMTVELGGDGDAAAAFLDGGGGLEEVAALIGDAAAADITAVPTYVIDGAWAIPGAQDPDTFVSVIRKLADRARAE